MSIYDHPPARRFWFAYCERPHLHGTHQSDEREAEKEAEAFAKEHPGSIVFVMEPSAAFGSEVKVSARRLEHPPMVEELPALPERLVPRKVEEASS